MITRQSVSASRHNADSASASVGTKSLLLLLMIMTGLASVAIPAQGPRARNATTPAAPASLPPFPETDPEKREVLAWRRQTLIDAYDRIGRRDAKWDDAVRKALEAFARLDLDSYLKEELSVLTAQCDAAIAAGCDDPLILYLRARHPPRGQRITPAERVEAYRQAADAMDQSKYSIYWKFYAAFRAASELKARDGTNASPDAVRWWRIATNDLVLVFNDDSVPKFEIYLACNDLLMRASGGDDEAAYRCMEQPLFRRWPNDSLPWLIKGRAYADMAWNARGGGYADTVTDEGWELFEKNLGVAEDALERAWNLNTNDSRIPLAMMTVELGQGKGRDRMELWFQRAMAIDPNNYAACESKRYYLEPKWHGSAAQMLAFGRECVQSKQWGGRTPLILAAAHEALTAYLEEPARTNYWKKPEVWPDVRSAFEKYLADHKDDTIERQRYALFAFRCEQWDVFKRQLPLLGEVDYSIFGGRRAFNQMVREANQHSPTRAGRRGRRN